MGRVKAKCVWLMEILFVAYIKKNIYIFLPNCATTTILNWQFQFAFSYRRDECIKKIFNKDGLKSHMPS